MAKANPKKWFPSRFTERIELRKVVRYEESAMRDQPYFDTWEEARAHAAAWAFDAIEDAKQEADAAGRAVMSAQRHAERVAALKPPADAE